MRPPIDGGIVLLTGASSGIGRAMAVVLAPRAKVLILVARRKERLEELRAELETINSNLVVDLWCCDLTEEDVVPRLIDGCIQNHGQIDVLINNAGFGDLGVFHQVDSEKYDRMIRLNITALTLLCHRVLPEMLQRGSGGILNVSSGFGLIWTPYFSVYCATKQYVTAFTDGLRAEVKGTGVVISQLCPGPVRTEFMAVAGNGDVLQAPPFVELSAEQCAKRGIKAFSKGKALKVPGFWIGLGMFFLPFVPRFVFRFVYGLSAKRMRKML